MRTAMRPTWTSAPSISTAAVTLQRFELLECLVVCGAELAVNLAVSARARREVIDGRK